MPDEEREAWLDWLSQGAMVMTGDPEPFESRPDIEDGYVE